MIDLEAELRGGLTDVANLVTTSPDPWADYRQRVRREPRRRRMALGLSVVAVAAATVAIVIGAFALASGDHSTRPPTALTSTQSLLLTPRTQVGAPALAAAATVLEQRLRALGVGHAQVTVAGDALRARVPVASVPTLRKVAGTQGTLRFRRVLSIADPGSTSGTPAQPSTAAQSPTLTAAFMETYDQWDCRKNSNPTNGNDNPNWYIISCGTKTDGFTKYLLAPAAVEGTQVTDADGTLDNETGTQWVVNLTFNGNGATTWQELTKQAYNVTNGTPSTSCSPPTGCNAVAIVLDGVVESAPYISQAGGIAGGRAQISGNFTQDSAEELADVLKYGALPTTFTVGR